MRSTRIYVIILIFFVIGIVCISLAYTNFQKTTSTGISQENTIVVQDTKTPLPIRIKIPVLKLDALIQHVGILPSGEMDVPTNTIETGWYALGTRPGERGSAVIAGHDNDENGAPAVFGNLQNVKVGDQIIVQNELKEDKIFIVREMRMYNANADASIVFSRTDGEYLNLITCDGVWDTQKKSYTKRLVVFTEAVK